MQKNQEALQQKISGLTAEMEAERRQIQEALQKIQEDMRKKKEAIQEEISRLNAEVEAARQRVVGRQADR